MSIFQLHLRAALVALATLFAFAFHTVPAAAQEIQYGQIVGIFSPSQPYRLDIGTRATKENVPASHESWATRLRIRRIDGRSEGPVMSNHLVGFFSEDDRYRLDIGNRATKENVPSSHRSWATLLRIQRLDGPSTGAVYYGDLVGVFSEDNRYRLDIGTRAMKENVPASHRSWATELTVRPE